MKIIFIDKMNETTEQMGECNQGYNSGINLSTTIVSGSKDIHSAPVTGSKTKRRGKYAPYPPKLRAEIAKFCSNHTNLVSILMI